MTFNWQTPTTITDKWLWDNTNTTSAEPKTVTKTWISSASSDIDDYFACLNRLANSINSNTSNIKTEYKTSLKPESIDVNGDYTTVHWNDGTHTVVKRAEDEPDNLYAAFCAALAKKLYGSTANVHKLAESVETGRVKAKKEQECRERIAAQKAKEQRDHERKVKAMAKKLALEEEVQKYFKEHKKDLCA